MELTQLLLKILGLSGKTKLLYKGSLSWPGDVQKTRADISRMKALGFAPKFGLEKGLKAFLDWYESEHGSI